MVSQKQRRPLLFSACLLAAGCGVPKSGVLDATTSIKTQVEVAQAALSKCAAGEAPMCDMVGHNLSNIASHADGLAELAAKKKESKP